MARPRTISDADLLALARRVFRERGHQATTREVAAAAGLSQAALFKRFASKEALFLAALGSNEPSLQEFVAIAPHADDPRAYLAAVAGWIMQHNREVMPTVLSLASHPRYGRELMAEVHRHHRAGEICAILAVRLRRWQESGQLGPVPLVPFTHIFVQALVCRAIIEIWSGSDPSPSRPEDLRSFVEVFWQGLAPVEASPSTKGRKRPAAKTQRTQRRGGRGESPAR